MTARTYIELFERPYHLQLERESAEFWIVCDGDTVMMRSADRELCARFMAAFVAKTPGASMAEEHSWRVAQKVTMTNAEMTARYLAGFVPRVGTPDGLATVYRIRPHEQLDESA